MSFAATLERLARLENPYPGLRPFERSEAHLFFGRDQQILDLLDRLARHRFVAVLGLSGSGKSSLVRAGLIPALMRGHRLETALHWHARLAHPAGTPFANLAAVLGCEVADLRTSSHGLIDHVRSSFPKGEGLLICIDQFEELFRYKDLAGAPVSDSIVHAGAASEAAAFIELLLASTRSDLPIYVVITMRTDYLGDCAEFPGFPEILNESQYLVPRLSREQRRQAIEGALGRVQISSALVEQLLNVAGDEPDQLPTLQHVLMRTWTQWRKSSIGADEPIGVEHYAAAGGFEGALNQHADELLNAEAVRRQPKFVEIIFKRLTALGRGKRERRDPAPLSELWELCDANSKDQRRIVCEIIDLFRSGNATFLTPRKGELTPETYIDIAHESLIRNWKILAENWLPEEERQSKTFIELLDRARGWRAGNKEVLIGLDLSGALEWDARRNRSGKWSEHYAGHGAIDEVETFLAASRNDYEEAERTKSKRRERELRHTRLVAIIAGVALLIVSALCVYTYLLKSDAERQRKLAVSRELSAKAETLVSAGDLGEALDMAMQAFSIEKTSEAREAIAHASAQEVTRLEGHSKVVSSAVFSPDGQFVVTASGDKTARVWSAATGQVIAKLEGHSGFVSSAEFSPDGKRVVTASRDKTARVWNTATGLLIATLEGHSNLVYGAEFSPDGQRIATASEDNTARVWNAQDGRLIAKLEGHSDVVYTAEFSPDGQRVVTASGDKTARVWNDATGQLIAKLEGHSGAVSSAEFSSDGQRVVTASDDKTARVWNAATGQLIATLEGHSGAVSSAVFSSDGQRVVTASGDKTARVWDAATGKLIAKLEGHSGPVSRAEFSPDGQRVVTASGDKTARVWNVATGQMIANLEGHSDAVYRAVFSPNGQFVATASGDKTARVWNTTAGQVTARLEGHSDAVSSAAFSPDGQRVVTASADNTARVWNTDTGRMIANLQGHSGPVTSADFSRDGQRVVTASGDGTARVWDIDTGRMIANLQGHSGPVTSAVFSRDGERVVTASGDKTAHVWSASTGHVMVELDGHSDLVSTAAFSPDGQRVVTASRDKTARVWNAATGEVIATLGGHSDAVYTAEFSPDGQRVVTASRDQTARVWNAATGGLVATLAGHSDVVYTAEFSPDGQRVVTASRDKTAQIWDAATGKMLARLEGHSNLVHSAVFSPDGRRVVTASWDKTALVWNAATGRLIAKLEGHSNVLYTAAFSPDGRVVTASGDKTSRIYRILTLDDTARLLTIQ